MVVYHQSLPFLAISINASHTPIRNITTMIRCMYVIGLLHTHREGFFTIETLNCESPLSYDNNELMMKEDED